MNDKKKEKEWRIKHFPDSQEAKRADLFHDLFWIVLGVSLIGGFFTLLGIAIGYYLGR